MDSMNFEFGMAWAFFLIPLPLLIYLLLPPLRKRNSSLIAPAFFRGAAISGASLREGAWISRRNAFQWLVVVLIWLLLIAAFASPQLVGQPEKKVKTARSFLVVSDISFSMAIKDWTLDGQRVSRWEAVREVMSEFLSLRKSDKVGLIFFGTNPYLQAPLTTDLEVIQWMLDETEVGMAGQTTGIGAAIGMGIDVLKEDSIDQKVMLLLTDGVDSGSEVAPLDAASLAQSDSIVIYTMGIGDPSRPSSDLDEKTLRDIADATDGQYFLAIDQSQLENAYQTLNDLEPMEYEDEDYVPRVLLYKYPLLAALGLALVYQLLMNLINLLKRRES